MNILLISQCNKRALVETRRVLDQFAERRGERTWQTAITLQGLQTLRKMLKKSARRNTAVACHRIGGKNYSELLWVVGNANKFNTEGTIPTNFTRRNVLKADDENQWHTAEDIALLAALAALFHDFGKANDLFQKKLKTGKNLSEPYRHEWVSLRMFEAFVRGEPDEQWLRRLTTVSSGDEQAFLGRLKEIQDGPDSLPKSPFRSLPPLAQAIGWLILTHHKLPRSMNSPAPLKWISDFLGKSLLPDWNSPQIQKYGDNDLTGVMRKELRQVWDFPAGTPFRSDTWCSKARRIARRLLERHSIFGRDWLDDSFSIHISRMALMLADHHYSSLSPHEGNPDYGDASYVAYANTDSKTRHKTGPLKQRLDEHLVGVYKHSLWIMRTLPGMKDTLPAIGRHSAFKKRTRDARFLWQNKAYDLAYSLKDQAQTGGFFGVNMASTGCGKTFANARIMYALADEKRGCRFSVALGLRTLTLQTGDAFRQILNLDEDDMAVLIGSAAIRKLHEDREEQKKNEDNFSGSESAEPLLDTDYHVRYEGALADNAIKRWLESPSNNKLNSLVSAPILVSTIDHLMPATEGTRGGKQIAPMLRLLTSDLVVDEPDEFGLTDLPALTRLVGWAGMLGSKVVLSSATLAPALVAGLFRAYSAGRNAYNNSCGNPNQPQPVCCAWFDETKAEHAAITNAEEFRQQHSRFTEKRVARLSNISPKRQAELLSLPGQGRQSPDDAIAALGEAISEGIHRLHHDHHQEDPKTKKKVSLGVVRMANINPLVAVAKYLLQHSPPDDTTIHYCIYHSRFPLIVRSETERILDTVLNRKEQRDLWHLPEIKQILKNAKTTNHIFVVLASPVAEVGRDHDYDWAIAEPSSMRSIVQLAGRVLRHRERLPEKPNVLLLEKNYRGMTGKRPAFCRPGFEHRDRPLQTRKLSNNLLAEQYRVIDARPCLVPRTPLRPAQNLADMEHQEIYFTFHKPDDPREPYALQWLKPRATLTGELQRCTPFRQSFPEEDYFLQLEGDDEEFTVIKWHENGEPKPCSEIEHIPLEIKAGNTTWGHVDYVDAMNRRAQQEDSDMEELSHIYGVFSLPQDKKTGRRWRYTPKLGFYRSIL
ncbi:MAG: type I-F CRISPR-associated helicase Cas3f [Desulfurellaceae bacterium]|nr:type I-F CRISPR-associated helicase Cas3f [Desulfurellaceae bacterium]